MQFPTGPLRAYANIAGEGDLGGVVKFYQTQWGVLVTAEVWGLPAEGVFGFHIHEGTSCGGEDFADTGNHYNPTNREHPFHAGDLPPLFSCGGRAWLAVMTDRFQPEDVVGQTVVVHAHPDDMHTQPSGNSGEKIACGVIRAFGQWDGGKT